MDWKLSSQWHHDGKPLWLVTTLYQLQGVDCIQIKNVGDVRLPGAVGTAFAVRDLKWDNFQLIGKRKTRQWLAHINLVLYGDNGESVHES